jgi:arylsulfatase
VRATLRRLVASTPAAGAALLAGLGLAACGRAEPARFALLLTSDTLRADRLSAWGGPRGLAPRLDALLEESVVFESAFAPCSYTLPSVSALLTGRHPEELGLYGNASRMGAEFATLAGVLGLHGWRTGAVVSNYVLRQGTGFEQGFEIYDATFPQREANREMPERIAGATTDAALEVLDRLRAGGRPVFLWVHYQDPHGPYTPPGELRERFLEAARRAPGGDRRLEVDPEHRGHGSIPAYQSVGGHGDVAFYRAGYDGEVAYLDAEVARLLDGLDERGLLERAFVVFTADHGESLGEDDYWFAHGEYLTEPLVRVPLAFRVPGRAPERRGDLAALVDVFPTLLGMLGIAAAPGQPGRDLLAPGAEAEGAGRAVYLAALHGAPVPRFGLVADGHQYLVSDEPGGRHESLRRLGEGRELATAEPERLAAMRERLDRVRAGIRHAPERVQPLGPAEKERLRQLGYVVD